MTAFFQELFQTALYKTSQGRIARQVTFAALMVIIGLGAWRLHEWLGGAGGGGAAYAWPIGVFAVGCWAAFRLIQFPSFADFLISVEAEMAKVSWPGQSELFKASAVVIIMIFFLAFLLALYDFVLQSIPAVWQLIMTNLFGGA